MDEPLSTQIARSTFRKDLNYRLRTHQVHIPPLRERPDDLPHLLDHFLDKAARTLSKKKPPPPPELLTLLSIHSFPGNMRELETLIFDAVTRHKSGVLSMESFREAIKSEQKECRGEAGGQTEPDLSFVTPMEELPTLQQAETFLISEALDRACGNQRIAASLLGISRQALNKRLKRNAE